MRLATLNDDVKSPMIESADGWHRARGVTSVLDGIRNPERVRPIGPPIPLPRFVTPYRPGTIIGIGLNYTDTVTEMGRPRPSEPYLFPKLRSSVTGPEEPIVIDEALTREVDWEGELAVIVGRTCRDVDPADAADVVFGYTVAQDISARDLQEKDGQWLRGKGLDTFCPFGPCVVTTEEVPPPQQLRIRTWVNDRLVQDGSTAGMIFTVAQLIGYCSTHFTLEPGDMILTGTPSGCGAFQHPPAYLHPGDTVKTRIDGIGELRNTVQARQRNT